MKSRLPSLILRSAPFLRRPVTTPGVMRDVIIALLPVIGAALWFFGLSALLVMAAAIAGCVGAEYAWGPGKKRGETLKDGSAILTGLLLALTLPPGIPLWIAFVGGVAGIGLGKIVWGGLGDNLFNPALVGRAFLQAAFPTVLTTWTAHGSIADFFTTQAATFAAPLFQGGVDAVTTATPLALMKFSHQVTPASVLFLGETAGSLGETCALAILVGAAYMAVRRTFDWRMPVSILVSAAVFSGILYLVGPDKYPPPMFTLLSGGLLLGAVYMATDPVTCPTTPLGIYLFGLGVGLLVVLIRVFGGLPEGVMYAILLMNAASPLIDRAVQPRVFGRTRKT